MNAAVVLLGPPAVATGLAAHAARHPRGAARGGLGRAVAATSCSGCCSRSSSARSTGSAATRSSRTARPRPSSNCLYFSFTTLTTVGYGDFTARSDLGHTLCVFEMLIGQIYLVTVVSLIVSNLPPRAGA